LVAALVALTTLSTAVAAQPLRQTAVRADGQIDATVWQAASPADAFKQREPTEGADPSQRTEFRVAYDASTLHVKVRAYDTEPEKIVGYLTRRDADSPSDWIHVLVDSYHDRRTAYEFAVNPAGVKRDSYRFNDNNDDDGWDAVWDVTVTRDSDGWSAEFHIPLSQLRFTPGESTTFGLAVARKIGRLNETSTWPLLARSATGYVSLFGELTGLAMTASPKRLELAPYTVATLARQPTAGNPLLDATAPGAKAGLDMKYALTPGLTLTATINPDFGQVEADPAVVNLSAFETFFNERRAFFVEGSGAFRFDSDCLGAPCTTLYSRRIGRAPQGELPSGTDIFSEAPLQTTILGAAKLTGRVGRFAVGLMQALTQEETGTVLESGRMFERPVEPLTNYTVARVRRDFANQSAIGGIATLTQRRLTANLRSLADTAFVGGLDWDLRFKRVYGATGYWAASTVRGTTDAVSALQQTSRHYFQRPGAESFALDESRTSLNGSSGRIGITKIGGSRLRFNANVGYMSPGWEVNDLGYLQRADQRWAANWLQLRSETPTRRFRQRYLNFNHWTSWNADGDRVAAGSNVNGNVELTNNWRTGGGLGRDWQVFDDRLTRGGPGGLSADYTFFWSSLNSDDRRVVRFNLFNGGGRNRQGSWHRDHEFEVTYRPTTALVLTPGIRLNRRVRDDQWVGQVEGTSTPHYAFARLDQTTLAFTARVNYTLSPDLSLQLYAEPFASGGGYTGFKELVDGRHRDYQGRYAPFDYSGGSSPDFNVRSFRTTNVLRWEFRPGSTVFVVWQQAREGSASFGNFRFGRDFGGVFRSPARNVFLVKMAYWLNY
jgi:hypothetical protein